MYTSVAKIEYEENERSNLSGPQKAASFLLSLPANYVQKIFNGLDEDEISSLSKIMINLGKIHAETVEDIYQEFIDRVAATGALMGSVDTTEKLLNEALGDEKANAIISSIKGPEGRTIWHKLCNINIETLVSFLKKEHPQTVAIILSQIKPDYSAQILQMLPRDLSINIMMRTLNMGAIQEDIMKDIEGTLEKEFMNTIDSSSNKDPHQIVAEIFNSFERSTEELFMEGLEEKSEEDAEIIKSLMFTFEDLLKVDGTGIQNIIRNIDQSRLAIALRGADDEHKKLFFSNMSERAGKLMKEDMDEMGPVKLKTVEEAQSEIVRIAKGLMDSGEIVVRTDNDDEEYV